MIKSFLIGSCQIMLDALNSIDLFESNDLNDRLWNLKYKMSYPIFKPRANYMASFEANTLNKTYFWGYILSRVIPKCIGTRTPAQVIYKNIKVTTYTFDDLEFLDTFSSFALLKIKRIIRFAEEAWVQNKKFSYRELAFLTCATTNSVFRWVKDCKDTGFNPIPYAKASLPSRKTYIMEDLLTKNILLKPANPSSIINLCWITYSTWSEIQWMLLEMMVCILAIIFKNKASKVLIEKLSIPNMQQLEYTDLYKKHQDIVDAYFKNFFNQCLITVSPLEIICKAIAFLHPSYGDFKKISKKIGKSITDYESNHNAVHLDDDTILFRLKSKSLKKHKTIEQNAMKVIPLNLFNDNNFKTFKGSSNKELIQKRVKSLLKQAKLNNCHISQTDICFLLSLSREVYRGIDI